MKSKLLFLVLIFFALTFALQAEENTEESEKQNAVTIGILQGGGSLIGLDYERLVFDNIGIQIGMGYIGFGGGLTFHLKPTTDSSAISASVWNQGVPGTSASQTMLGMTFIFRGWHWFTAQIGMAYILYQGQAVIDNLRAMGGEPVPVCLLYSIGWYGAF